MAVGALLVAWLLLGRAAPAQAGFWSSAVLNGRTLASLVVEEREDYQPIPYDQRAYLRLMRYEDPQELIDQAIAWENWEAWQIFQATPAAAVPLAAAQLYIAFTTSLDLSRQSKVQNTYELAKLPPTVDWRDFKVYHPSVWSGLLGVDDRRTDAPLSWGPVSWLFEADGLFSGRPWDWDNAWPRILTIFGMVLIMLVVVEFLRLVRALGMRIIGRRLPGAGA